MPAKGWRFGTVIGMARPSGQRPASWPAEVDQALLGMCVVTPPADEPLAQRLQQGFWQSMLASAVASAAFLPEALGDGKAILWRSRRRSLRASMPDASALAVDPVAASRVATAGLALSRPMTGARRSVPF
jgi:hypothetical protein